ncbi:UrcA family protein [Aurantiacibacter rhizosphaerae]|uniref:UrcA family protein n=1 Tax=Aurantiacibacter rhizosphaerae TaxID=2691582 RepID=A0A844XEQ7_9SPHN|nr:UrcA family protein [Aurantiacibacter rhizosphaerae]MWV28233.1 UrcA family protein [Aurantiacibacter rhizosphaerae]
MSKISIKTGLVAALAAGAMFSAPAMAGSTDAPSIAVRYSDLDLSTAEGQDTLDRRLTRAAEEVCGIDRRTSGMALPSAESRSCYRNTVQKMEREIATRTQEQQQEQRG